MNCPTCLTADMELIAVLPGEAHLQTATDVKWCSECGTVCKSFSLDPPKGPYKVWVPKIAKGDLT